MPLMYVPKGARSFHFILNFHFFFFCMTSAPLLEKFSIMEDDPLLVNSDATADANCEPTDDGQELVPDGGHHAHPTNSWLAT